MSTKIGREGLYLKKIKSNILEKSDREIITDNNSSNNQNYGKKPKL